VKGKGATQQSEVEATKATARLRGLDIEIATAGRRAVTPNKFRKR